MHNKLMTIPSLQSVHPNTNGLLNTNHQHTEEVVGMGAKAMYASQINVHVAITNALNKAVPEGYKSSSQLIGARVYYMDDCLYTLLVDLQMTYR
jgi:hypothetical protein